MSKLGKLRAKEQRKAKKRARKEAEQKKYEAWRQQGINSKSKRHKKQDAKLAIIQGVSHALGPCGNIGCKRCNPSAYNIMTVTQLNVPILAAPLTAAKEGYGTSQETQKKKSRD